MGKETNVIGLQRPLSPYQAILRSLSERLVQAQRPLRILEAIRWDSSIELAFFAGHAQQQPPMTRDYYSRRPLSFDPAAKRLELQQLENDIRLRLGPDHPAGQILLRMCREYREVVELLRQRGTPAFSKISGRLYGSTLERSQTGASGFVHLGRLMSELLPRLSQPASLVAEEPRLDALQTVAALSVRLQAFFKDQRQVHVRLADNLAADAAAGCDYIKIRNGAHFSLREIRLLEVHEGWVHLGTTLNGQLQPICTFLSKGPPSCTLTQEGLAVLTEVLALASHPARVQRLISRCEGVALAENGASFLEVYRFFLQKGYPERDSYQLTMRLFRGSLPEGCGPYTKDLCYSRGFVQLCGFLQQAVTRGWARRLPLLFCGKTSLEDLPLLAQLLDEGLLLPPRYVPPVFAQLPPLSPWLGQTG